MYWATSVTWSKYKPDRPYFPVCILFWHEVHKPMCQIWKSTSGKKMVYSEGLAKYLPRLLLCVSTVYSDGMQRFAWSDSWPGAWSHCCSGTWNWDRHPPPSKRATGHASTRTPCARTFVLGVLLSNRNQPLKEKIFIWFIFIMSKNLNESGCRNWQY